MFLGRGTRPAGEDVMVQIVDERGRRHKLAKGSGRGNLELTAFFVASPPTREGRGEAIWSCDAVKDLIEREQNV